jgi:hypothetical protein
MPIAVSPEIEWKPFLWQSCPSAVYLELSKTKSQIIERTNSEVDMGFKIKISKRNLGLAPIVYPSFLMSGN